MVARGLRRREHPSWAWLLLVVVPACGGPAGPAAGTSGPIESSQLDEVYSLVKQHLDARKSLPKGPSDLRGWSEGFPTGYFAVQSGRVVVNWATPPSETGEAVLAYEKDAPTAGGLVILQNRTVKQMTAAEFQAAPKAGN